MQVQGRQVLDRVSGRFHSKFSRKFREGFRKILLKVLGGRRFLDKLREGSEGSGEPRT